MNPLLYEAKNAANHYEREDLLDLISRMAKELERMYENTPPPS